MRWFTVTVRGPSMVPTLRSGDTLLVMSGGRVRPGDLVVARFAHRPQMLVVKRAVRPEPDGWQVASDNPYAGGDSAVHGPAEVVGRVVLRCWPRPGRLSRTGPPTGPVEDSATDVPAAEEADVRADSDEDPVFAMHRGGKLEVRSTVPLRDAADLSMAYTPGVARVCSAIAVDSELAAQYTWAARTVAVVTDGSAVLGLGDIGPQAALPVMEGKAVLFKVFGGVDAVPICLATQDVDEIVETVARLAPSFGGINLEDISAPRCFAIEDRLTELLDIPVFHDDQHGTAVVVLAALRNAARLTGRGLGDLRVVVSGAGAAGVAVSRILLEAGIGDIAVADSQGILHAGRPDLTSVKAALAGDTNSAGLAGSLEAALAGADVFIGLSAGRVGEAAVATMAPDAIIFAMANPDPEVPPDVAHRHARVVATGRSDYPNQINNVLAFPGIFRGAFDVRARRITEGMKLAAAKALSDVVAGELRVDLVIPSPFDPRVAPAVAAAVSAAAQADGVARA